MTTSLCFFCLIDNTLNKKHKHLFSSASKTNRNEAIKKCVSSEGVNTKLKTLLKVGSFPGQLERAYSSSLSRFLVVH